MTSSRAIWTAIALLGILILVVLVFLFEFRQPTTGAVGVQLSNTAGTPMGSMWLRESPVGLDITGEVQGLEPGAHGIHIHETGRCEQPDFESAGEHLNPYGTEHGLDNPDGPHLGDMPNLLVREGGAANYQTQISPRLSDLADSDGSALVIHANEDDQVTDPSGGSGARVACGVIGG